MPGASGVPARAEPPGATSRDERQQRERFNVAHQRRPAAHAAFGDPHRLETRQTGATRQVADHRRFFARDERVGCGDDRDRHRVKSGPTPFVEHVVEGRDGYPVVHVEIGVRRVRRARDKLQTIEHKMRTAREQPPILRARRLTFGAVANHDRPATCCDHRFKLAVQGEAGTAMPGQTAVGSEPHDGARIQGGNRAHAHRGEYATHVGMRATAPSGRRAQ